MYPVHPRLPVSLSVASHGSKYLWGNATEAKWCRQSGSQLGATRGVGEVGEVGVVGLVGGWGRPDNQDGGAKCRAGP